MTHDLLFCPNFWTVKDWKFLRWLFLDMICLQNHPKVDRKKRRHDVIIVTSKLTLWHNITIILYEKIFASTRSVIFPYLQVPLTVERFWFKPTAWGCDVMTSQHDAPKLIFPISACRYVLERWFFFVAMKLWVAEFENVVSFVFAWWRHVMTSCHDVTNRLYSISACRSAREMIFFFSIVFPLA